MKKLKIRKSNLLINLFLVGICLVTQKVVVYAETVITIVTAGNPSPVITSGPETSTPSDGNNPINVGNNITFQANASDTNAEDYYLVICKSDQVVPGSGGSTPICSGGSWCISPVTDSGVQATCSYTIQSTDPQSNNWFAFVCDNNSSFASCSSSGNTGSGNTGSPFKVNHNPGFSGIADNGGSGIDTGADPSGAITFTSTASDGDDDTLQDSVKLIVCADSSGATSSGCTGTLLCSSDYTASNPTCQLNISSVSPDGTFSYYAYIFDNHGFGSALNYITGSYVVNNVAPSVISLILNESLDINLAEGNTTDVQVTTTVRDNNSCQDITTVETSVYRSGIGYALCDTNAEDNDNYCYSQVNCNVVGGACSDSSDAFVDYLCSVALQYHADPTVSGTQFPLENWRSTINVIDNNALSANLEVSAGVEVDTTSALDSTSTINFGDLDIGEKNDPLDKVTVVTSTGNIGVDTELSGTDMTNGGSGLINVSYQKLSLTNNTSYSGGISLTVTHTEYEINVLKTTNTINPATKNIWWGLEIPMGIPPGVYSGINSMTAVPGELLEW